MTQNQQRRLYFPAWTAAFRANWTSARGRVQDAAGHRPSEWRARVMAAAEVRARAGHRGITQDDLRHACHVVAFGKDRSSTDLKPLQMRRVLHLFKLLEDPDNLDALMRWMDPRKDERDEAAWFLEHRCREGYVRHVSADIHGTARWETLSDVEVIALANTLRSRRNGQWCPPPRPTGSRYEGGVGESDDAASCAEDDFSAVAAEMMAMGA